jgi:spore germination cell wall hydrolase CwlJ-like protein
MRKVITALILIMTAIPAEADEVECLAKNIYYEARDQNLTGMYAVAGVTLNRVKDRRWPNDICGVVKQRKVVQNQWICQFSWFCDGLSDNPKDLYNWNVCYTVAYIAMTDKTLKVIPSDIYWYHSNKVEPYWASAYTATAVIGDHIFYSDR